LQRFDRIELVIFDRGDDSVVERRAVGGDAERAVTDVPAGPAGDLRELGGLQISKPPPVEFSRGGEGDMVDIHVEAHADCVSRDKVVDLARLVDFGLRVAGARRERAKNDRRAAPLSPHQFGDRIDRVSGKSDNRSAARQAGHFLAAGIGQRREALPCLERYVRKQAAQDRAHRAGAEEHRLLGSARMQEARGENPAAFGVGGELDLIDRQEFRRAVERHRLDRRHPIGRRGRNDFFLARDKRDLAGGPLLDQAVIDLAREEAKRQPDHPRPVRQHAVDSVVGLAGVGRPEEPDQGRPLRLNRIADLVRL